MLSNNSNTHTYVVFFLERFYFVVVGKWSLVFFLQFEGQISLVCCSAISDQKLKISAKLPSVKYCLQNPVCVYLQGGGLQLQPIANDCDICMVIYVLGSPGQRSPKFVDLSLLKINSFQVNVRSLGYFITGAIILHVFLCISEKYLVSSNEGFM